MRKFKRWLWVLLACVANAAVAAPAVVMGKPETYCVTYCYIRIPFTVTGYDPAHKIGRVFCDLKAEVTSKLPVYNGEARSRDVDADPIGVFKNDEKGGVGDVEMSTGVIVKYFVGAKLKSAACHL